MIVYAIILHWIRICGLEDSPGLNQESYPSLFLNLAFSVVRFDRFQFQTLFSNILDFS